MNSDLVLPLITSVGWLILVTSALASHRLGWGRLLKMALAWLVLFGAIFLIVEWFLYVRSSTTAMI